MRYLLGDESYDANRLRRSLRETGTTPSSQVGEFESA